MLFFHVFLENKINIGYSSNLPAIISNVNINLENHEKSENPPAGPTAPRPGPILDIQDRDAVIIVSGFASSLDIAGFQIEINNVQHIITIIYNIKNDTVESITFLSRGLPSNLITSTLLGEIIDFIFDFEYLAIIKTLDCFIPPAVEPAQAPQSIKKSNMQSDNTGQLP